MNMFMKKILVCLLCLFIHFTILTAEESKAVLVTGGAGFLGSHMCDRLIQKGHRVYCLDNLSTGSQKNIEHLLNHPNFTFLLADVTKPIELEVHLDEIFNFACPASPVQYQLDPIKTLKTNVWGSLFLLQLAEKTHAKIFQASTSEVYGDPLKHPQQETDWGNVNPIGIRSCYDEGKRCAETLFFDYHRSHGIRIKVGRIFNTYGPRMSFDDGRVISNFIIQALNDSPITVYGNGDQTRSFCYVDDLIDAICAFMNTSDAVIGPMNLGNPQEHTILQIAAKVMAFTDSHSPIIFKPLPQDDPRKRRPDISLAQQILHWSPKISLDEGLNLTITDFKNRMKNQ